MSGVAVQGELGDHQHSATDVNQRPIHLAFGIREEPQRQDLLDHPVDLWLGVGVGDADEREITASDGADDLPVNRHGSAGDTLEDDFHTSLYGD